MSNTKTRKLTVVRKPNEPIRLEEGEESEEQVAGRVVVSGHGRISRPPAACAAAVPVRPRGGRARGAGAHDKRVGRWRGSRWPCHR